SSDLAGQAAGRDVESPICVGPSTAPATELVRRISSRRVRRDLRDFPLLAAGKGDRIAVCDDRPAPRPLAATPIAPRFWDT
ncbi:MAG: hypothetical protein KY475_05720, partial [Planctomycetes bacterium]|nr:hypothetical protein [Planctomycetota bacterium]